MPRIEKRNPGTYSKKHSGIVQVAVEIWRNITSEIAWKSYQNCKKRLLNTIKKVLEIYS